MLPKLLFRALPNHYIPKNVYSHFPFIVPSRMREFLEKNEKMFHQYDYNPPQPREVIQPIRDYNLVKDILSDTTDFLGPYEPFALICPHSQGFYFGGAETQSNRRNRKLVCLSSCILFDIRLTMLCRLRRPCSQLRRTVIMRRIIMRKL